MGIFEYPVFDKKAMGHTGAIDGFSSILLYLPEDKLSLAIVSNGKGYDMGKVAKAAIASYYTKPFELPVFKTMSLTSTDLDKYLGEYSSPQIPVSFTFSKEGTSLVVTVSGQTPAKLEATDTNVFEYAAYKARFEFVPAENKMTLIQNGQRLEMTRK